MHRSGARLGLLRPLGELDRGGAEPLGGGGHGARHAKDRALEIRGEVGEQNLALAPRFSLALLALMGVYAISGSAALGATST